MKVPKLTLGVCWDEQEVRMVVLQWRSPGQYEWFAHAVEAISQRGPHELNCPQALALALQSLQLKVVLSRVRVVVGLPADMVTLGVTPPIKMPRNRYEFKRAWCMLRDEASRHLEANTYYDAHLLPESRGCWRLYSFAVAAERWRKIKSHLVSVHLTPYAYDLMLFAQLRSLGCNPDFQNDHSLTTHLQQPKWARLLQAYYQQNVSSPPLQSCVRAQSLAGSLQQKLVVPFGLALRFL